MIQHENSPVDMQDKLRKLAHYSGLLGGEDVEATRAARGSLGKQNVTVIKFPEDVPLRLLNNSEFDLTDSDHRYWLENQVSQIKPVLVILDPLYLLMPGVNLNQSQDITHYLRWLLRLRNDYNTAIILVHHQHKFGENSKGRRSGQRLMGSALFHGWSDSAIYTTTVPSARPGWLCVRMEREFRTMPPQGDLEIDLYLGRPGDIEQFDVDTRQTGGATRIIEDFLNNFHEKKFVTAYNLGHSVGLDMESKAIFGIAKSLGYPGEAVMTPRGMSYRIYTNGQTT
jgi:hypothetical protein